MPGELKYLANGLPVIVIAEGSGDAPYDANGVANPGFVPAIVATFATVEEVEDAQLHVDRPAPVETGATPDVAALQAQIAALSEALQRVGAAQAAAGVKPVQPVEPAPAVPPVAPPAGDPLAGLSVEQLQAAIEAKKAADAGNTQTA